jgi:hypothetical protein
MKELKNFMLFKTDEPLDKMLAVLSWLCAIGLVSIFGLMTYSIWRL